MKNGQHPELSGAVHHPNPEFYEVQTVPAVIKSVFDHFAQLLHPIRQNCRPDLIIGVPGSGEFFGNVFTPKGAQKNSHQNGVYGEVGGLAEG